MSVVAHVSIEVFGRPKSATSPDDAVCLMGGERFPRVYDAIKSVSETGLDQDMHVVWHHAPSYQSVTLAVEPEERPLNDFGNLRNRQVAAAVSLVQRYIGRLDAMIPRCAGKFLADMSRKAVSQSEHDV